MLAYVAADINVVVRASLRRQFLPGTPNLLLWIRRIPTRFLERVASILRMSSTSRTTCELFPIRNTETTRSLRFADNRSEANLFICHFFTLARLGMGLSSLKKKPNTVGLKQDSSLRVFARVEPQNDRRVTWIIRYHSVQSSSENPDHVIHPFLPPPKAAGYNVGKRSHGLLLPTTQSNFLRKNFVYRMLFKDIY